MRRAAAAAACCLSVAAAPSTAAPRSHHDWTAGPDFLAIAVDVAALRPLGLASLALGSTLFVLALPFAAAGENVAAAADTLIREPAVFTFARPIGEF